MRSRVAAIVIALGLVTGSAWAGAGKSIKSKHAVKIDKSKPHPAILYSDVLKSMTDQVFYEKAQMRFFEKVRMTFLPAFKDPKHIAAYNPESGAYLTSILTDSKGKKLQTVFWEAREEKFPIWKAFARGDGNPPAINPGKYKWTWYIDGEPFWELPFKVVQDKAADAYSKPLNYLEGPWSEWGYIYIPKGNTSQTPSLNFFLRNKKAKMGQWIDSDAKVEVRRGRTLVAQLKGTRLIAKPWWISSELHLRNAKDSGFAKASDLLKTGTYTVTVKLNGKHYATFSYKAKGGKIPTMGRQDRNKAKPMTYMEGLTDRFYIKRVK